VGSVMCISDSFPGLPSTLHVHFVQFTYSLMAAGSSDPPSLSLNTCISV